MTRRRGISRITIVALVTIGGCKRGGSDRATAIDEAHAPGDPGFSPERRPPGAGPELRLGAAHSCVLAEGAVRCWGANGSGQLGIGTTVDSLRPAIVPALEHVTAIALGNAHTCALLVDGTVRCWGSNTTGQLGDDTHVSRPIPAPVAALRGVIEIACGGNFTCARMIDRTVRCWGQNAFGQLGNGTLKESRVPALVVALREVEELSLGDFSACARLSDGTVRCWGGNAVGELGDGTNLGHPRAQPVAGLANVAHIAVGSMHACALMVDGSLRCWGGNVMGELGDGTKDDRFVPTVSGEGTETLGTETLAMETPAMDTLIDVSLGAHTSCGLGAGGGLWCWGWRAFGQLGDGALRVAPFEITRPQRVPGLSIARIAVGDEHVCARLDDSSLRCWGHNDHGQLGDGTRVDRATPVRIAW